MDEAGETSTEGWGSAAEQAEALRKRKKRQRSREVRDKRVRLCTRLVQQLVTYNAMTKTVEITGQRLDADLAAQILDAFPRLKQGGPNDE